MIKLNIMFIAPLGEIGVNITEGHGTFDPRTRVIRQLSHSREYTL